MLFDSYRNAIRDSRIATFRQQTRAGRARHEWLFRLRCAQGRDCSGYFKNLDLLGNAAERALLRGRGDAV